MMNDTLDNLRILIKKELAEYSTMPNRGCSKNNDFQRRKSTPMTFCARMSSKRRRLEQPVVNGIKSSEENQGVHPRWRLRMIEWAFKVIDHFDLDREIVSIAANYLDRYCLSDRMRNGIDRKTLQLLTITCLYISIKLFEIRTIRTTDAKTTLETLVLMTGSDFTIKQMEDMEYEVLDALKWQVHPPTEQVFIVSFMRIMPPSNTDMIQKLATYLVELAIMDSFFAGYRASEIAFAALLCSRVLIRPDMPPFSIILSQSQHHYYGIKNPRIRRCYDHLSHVLRSSGESFETDYPNDDKRIASPVSVSAAVI